MGHPVYGSAFLLAVGNCIGNEHSEHTRESA